MFWPRMTRREFTKALLSGVGTLAVLPTLAQTGQHGAFSFLLLGDLHFDRLTHHDLAWLERDKPDDLRQVRNYSRITTELLPGLFLTVRRQIAELGRVEETRPAFVLQLGD